MSAPVLPRDMGARRNFCRWWGGGTILKKAPLKTKMVPPPKKIFVLPPFLGVSEACSPEKILTMLLSTTFQMHLTRDIFRISFRGGGGVQISFRKWGYLGEATRLLWGSGECSS